jgi:hypothetical protein
VPITMASLEDAWALVGGSFHEGAPSVGDGASNKNKLVVKGDRGSKPLSITWVSLLRYYLIPA